MPTDARWMTVPVTPQPGQLVELLEVVTAELQRRAFPSDTAIGCGQVLYPLWPLPVAGEPFDLWLEYWTTERV